MWHRVNLAIDIPHITENSSQSSDRHSPYNRKLHKFARFHLSTLGIYNVYLNTSRCWEVFLIGQIVF